VHELHLPTFFDVEVANIVWKKLRHGELNRSEADFIIGQLPTLQVLRHAEAPLLPQAFDLAAKTQRTVYDCLYLALALQLGATMVTADERLANSLTGTPWATTVLRLQDVP